MRDRHEVECWIDAQLVQLALEHGAQAMDPAPAIERAVLDRCGHFESFPGLAMPTGEADRFHAPAACYHVYSRLQGARLDEGVAVTLVAACARNEPGADVEPGRLSRFRMREMVFAGRPEWVSRQRDEWVMRATAFAASLDLDGAMEPATDTFFGDPGRGRRLMQQLKTLKYELRMRAGTAGLLAVASFNLHESFFTSRFDIRMAGGAAAATGCAAFGIERWALAYLSQHHACLR